MSGKKEAIAQAYKKGIADGIRLAAIEVEKKHLEDGHHGPEHPCRTRGWILALLKRDDAPQSS